jgi:predicted transcriptional regulator of viral defense system
MTDQLANVTHQPFDYQYLKGLLSGYRYPRNKISKLLNSGEIIALKSGLYVLSERFGRDLVPEVVANLLYGPSYVSLDYALASYGLIPELAYQVTSVTTGRRKTFETAVGTFTYQHLKPEYYSLGYQARESGDSSYLIATGEKALCDKLYFASPLEDADALERHLFEDLRIDFARLRDLDRKLISRLAGLAGKRNLKLLKELTQ